MSPESAYEDCWGGFWNDAARLSPPCRHRHRIIASLVRTVPHRTVLDLGCGEGSLIRELIDRGIHARYSGADISSQALAFARTHVPEAEFQQLDLNRSWPTGPYDVVILSEVLEHLKDDADMLRRIAALARHLVVSVPGGPDDEVEAAYGHLRNYPGHTLVDKMEASGFEVLRFRRWGLPFYDMIRACVKQARDPYALTEGRYGILRKMTASLLYYLFFLNLVPGGFQVFALGRSRHPLDPSDGVC